MDRSAAARAPHLLCAEGLGYRYHDGRTGLADLSFTVEAGERVLVTGPSGAGKSTLARCVTGLIPHLYRGELRGRASLGGLDTASTPLWQLVEAAGLVFQNPAEQMLARTVEEEIIFGLENLGLAPREIEARVAAALARFGLEALRGRAPLTLSGGEQQKLALAAITARRPPLLVLDEPLSMLDTTAAAELVAYLGEQAACGTALLICEHRPEYLAGIGALRELRLAPAAATMPVSSDTATPLPVAPVAPGGGRPAAWSPPTAASVAGAPGSGDLIVEALGVELGGRAVLRDLNLTFRAGEVTALVGRNGVGKTTLLRSLAGLQPHRGRVRIASQPQGQDRPDLGLVFQNADLQLFNATVGEEILYRVRDPDRARYRWLLDALGLAAYEHTPPLLLSEGEKKRVALATVLMRRPAGGLLLDEPALGQDARHKEMLLVVLRGLAAAGQLVILTTHDLALAAHADRLLLLGQRGIAADGAPAQVLGDQAAWDAVGLSVPPWVRAS